jgi:hypothetical protein
MSTEHDERVDGRELRALDEPGSDALLVRGLIALLARLSPHVDELPNGRG